MLDTVSAFLIIQEKKRKIGGDRAFLRVLTTVLLSVPSETDTLAGTDSMLAEGKLRARQGGFADFLKRRKRWG